MSEDKTPRILRLPSHEEVKTIFQNYTMAVGKVAFAWNFLLEQLGNLFPFVCKTDTSIAYAIWYAPDNDRASLLMLKNATAATKPNHWPHHRPKAKEDIEWLVDRTLSLHNLRNDAVHAPCVLLTDADGSSMAASVLSEHRRAKNLRGKELLVELDWCEDWAERLSKFSLSIRAALVDESHPWPDRPTKPDRKTNKDI